MNQLAKDISAEVVELLHRYGFDLGDYSAHALVDYWMQQYPAPWIRLATIEALYQGRYKAISIEQILNLWRRRTRTLYHFNSEFERMISLRPMLSATLPVTSQSAEGSVTPANTASQAGQNQALSSEAIASASERSSDFSQTEISSTERYAQYSTISPYSARSSGEERRTPTGEPLPIDQFTPSLEVSDFYWRLKAVVQAMGAGTAEEIGRRN